MDTNPTPAIPPSRFTFLWWNLHNHAHFDPEKGDVPRHPANAMAYEEKRGRILAAVSEMTGGGGPDLFAACEITRKAAQDLLNLLPSGFALVMAPPLPHEDEFQVALFCKAGSALTPEIPILPPETEDVPRETRPMVVVHLTIPGHVIRFVACHWTGFDQPSSRTNRVRLADCLRRDIRKFLHPATSTPGTARHVVIVGDLNEEPMSDLFANNLEGWRDRRSSRPSHWRDADVNRVRLYNLAWRYLGEQIPHGADRPIEDGPAGTWYIADGGWKTFDHVLVSSGLLEQHPPYLDEANTRIRCPSGLLDDRGCPKPFDAVGQGGVSDHLPIAGQLILPGTSA